MEKSLSEAAKVDTNSSPKTVSVGQGFEKPQGSGVRVTRVRVRVRIFIPFEKPLPLVEGKGFGG